MTEITLIKAMQVRIPQVPNYAEVGGSMENVALFNEAELRAIGREWTKALIAHSKKRRLRHDR